MQTTTEKNDAAAAAVQVPLCDRPGCGQPALFSYVWEWGEKGLCCERHRFELNQTAGQISRTIQCTALDAGQPAPLLRDERTQLMAKALSAEAELEETKARGLDLYRQNTGLTQQVQSLTVRNREADAQLRDAKQRLADMGAQLERTTAELANTSDEVSRLRVLVPKADPEGATVGSKKPTK